MKIARFDPAPAPDATLPLFVYGTLRSDCCPDAVKPMRAGFKTIGRANVQGALFDLGSYPALVLQAEGGRVSGELVQLDERAHDETLRRLDQYEGCDPVNPHAGLYRRARTTATMEGDGTSRECWIYIYNRTVALDQKIDCGCWRAHRDERSRPPGRRITT